MLYPVNEVFESIQGEATFTGTPSIFVRLQGCNVGCPWCDTKHTWSRDEKSGQVIAVEDMLGKVGDSPAFALMTPGELLQVIKERFTAHHVVITGGEPCLHDQTMLTRGVIGMGKTVQIETSGSVSIMAHPEAWITVSPKFFIPGCEQPRADALLRADEIKMPVGKPGDVQMLLDLVKGAKLAKPIWLQPISQSPKATALCIEAATKHGFNVSFQVHKLIGAR